MTTATLLRGDDASALVDILDQAFEAPNIDLDLRRKSVHILRRFCGSQTILPHSCILSDNISKEGDIAFASGGFADVWKGRHNGNRVCIKAFRACTAENMQRVKQGLSQEIVIWRRLSHPNVLPVLGVSPKVFSLCVITEWMTHGDIVNFASRYPEVNRLRLLAETASGLHYLHSLDIMHGSLKPTNILIDHDFHPRLTDYGLTAVMLDSHTPKSDNTTLPSVNITRYMAPELLNPSDFGLGNSKPTKKSDVYGLGVVTHRVITGWEPSPEANDGVIIRGVVTGERPAPSLYPNGYLSDEAWNFISRCWAPLSDDRPDVNLVMDTLNDAANAVEVKRGKLYTIANDQGKRTSSLESDVLPSSLDFSRRRIGDAPIQQTLQPSRILETPSPFVTGIPVASKAPRGNEKNRNSGCGIIPPTYVDWTHHTWVTGHGFFTLPEPRERE